MSEKMLVTQALDERDLLVKKIADKIAKASFVDTIKPNEDKVFAKRTSKEEYAKEAESAYQQITDLIDRFQKIDAAIVASNANMEITTSYGTFTVAGAIALRSRLRGLVLTEAMQILKEDFRKSCLVSIMKGCSSATERTVSCSLRQRRCALVFSEKTARPKTKNL